MTVKHPLHYKVGKRLEKEFEKNVILDSACANERRQRIPIFIEEPKSFEAKICDVDILILKDEKIKIIIEIEESNITPTQICGKFLTSVLGKYYIHEKNNCNRNSIPYSKSVLFMQILNNSKLKMDKTKKIEQGKKIEQEISRMINSKGWKYPIKEYRLIYTKKSEIDNIESIVEIVKKKLNYAK